MPLTPEGIVMLVILHPKKAFFPMVATLSGIITLFNSIGEVSPYAVAKAPSPMAVMPSSIIAVSA